MVFCMFGKVFFEKCVWVVRINCDNVIVVILGVNLKCILFKGFKGLDKFIFDLMN